MPLTFLAHQAPVLPLVLLWPRRFDGVALCVGSMVPDFAYVAAGTSWRFVSHSAWGLAWFCVPVALVVSVVVRWISPTVLGHLPAELRDGGGRLVGPTPPLLRTLVSVAIGAASHVLVDACTHRRGFVVERLPELRWAPLSFLGEPVPIYKLLQIPGSLVLAGLAWLGVRSLVRRGVARALPVATVESRRWFVAVCVAGLVVSVAVAWWSRALGGAPGFLFRVVSVGFVGVVVAAVAASPRMRDP